MRTGYVMQSVNGKRRYRRRDKGRSTLAIVCSSLFVGMILGSGIVVYFTQVKQPLKFAIASKKTVPKVKKVHSNEYDFYTLLDHPPEKADVVKPRGQSAGYLLQVGAFRKITACRHLQDRLADNDFPVLKHLGDTLVHGSCRVSVGPYRLLSDAYAAQKSLLRIGFRSLLKKVDN